MWCFQLRFLVELWKCNLAILIHTKIFGGFISSQVQQTSLAWLPPRQPWAFLLICINPKRPIFRIKYIGYKVVLTTIEFVTNHRCLNSNLVIDNTQFCDCYSVLSIITAVQTLYLCFENKIANRFKMAAESSITEPKTVN